MANHLSDILSRWYPERDACQWVLGTVYATEGPSYRKAGAMMLFNDLGQQFGLLSGGCLEADIHRRARQVMTAGRSQTLCYDGSDEDDIAFQLGIGCGGRVHILLQPLTADNNYLDLADIREALERGRGGVYRLLVDDSGRVGAHFLEEEGTGQSRFVGRGRLAQSDGAHWLETPVRPPPHLLVVGGGVDARPLVAMAAELGWIVTLCDPRPANARREYFEAADTILRDAPETLSNHRPTPPFDAAVVMTHNLDLDARALAFLAKHPTAYMALIGPVSRRSEVLELAGIGEKDLAVALASPAGLDLGGELPESIALSILAECHAALAGAGARPLRSVKG